jgi:hypothetical protein
MAMPQWLIIFIAIAAWVALSLLLGLLFAPILKSRLVGHS